MHLFLTSFMVCSVFPQAAINGAMNASLLKFLISNIKWIKKKKSGDRKRLKYQKIPKTQQPLPK